MAAVLPSGNNTYLQNQFASSLSIDFDQYLYILAWVKMVETTENSETYIRLYSVAEGHEWSRTQFITNTVTPMFYTVSNSGASSISDELGGSIPGDDIRDAGFWGDGEWHLMALGGQMTDNGDPTGRLAHKTFADGQNNGASAVNGGNLTNAENGPDIVTFGAAAGSIGGGFAIVDGMKFADCAIIIRDTELTAGDWTNLLAQIPTIALAESDVVAYWPLESDLTNSIDGTEPLVKSGAGTLTFDADIPDLTRSIAVDTPSTEDPVTVTYPTATFDTNSLDTSITDYRATRLTVTNPDPRATRTQWEINLGGDSFYITTTSTTSVSGSVLGGTVNRLDYWFPPSQEGRVRYRQYVTRTYRIWSEWVNFTALGYVNSYDKAIILNRGTLTVS